MQITALVVYSFQFHFSFKKRTAPPDDSKCDAIISFFIISEQLLISLNTKMSATIPMEATDLCFSVLFIILFKVVLIFESVDEILKCDHSSESY